MNLYFYKNIINIFLDLKKYDFLTKFVLHNLNKFTFNIVIDQIKILNFTIININNYSIKL